MSIPLSDQASIEQAQSGVGPGTADTEPRYQIGAVATRTQLSHQTLRHWDEESLISPSGRSEGGFRLYSESDVQRLLVIRRMKPLEFSIAQMRQLLDALDVLNDPEAGPEMVDAAADYLLRCHEQAEQSLARIRKRLAYAEELTEILAAQVRSARVQTRS